MKKGPFKMRSGNKPSISKMAGVSPMKQDKVTSRLTRVNKKTGKLEIIENPGKKKEDEISKGELEKFIKGNIFKDKGLKFGEDKFIRPISRKDDPNKKLKYRKINPKPGMEYLIDKAGK